MRSQDDDPPALLGEAGGKGALDHLTDGMMIIIGNPAKKRDHGGRKQRVGIKHGQGRPNFADGFFGQGGIFGLRPIVLANGGTLGLLPVVLVNGDILGLLPVVLENGDVPGLLPVALENRSFGGAGQ